MNRRAVSRVLKDPLQVAKTIDKLFGDDLHTLRVLSLANGVVGVLHAAVLSIHAIGRAYASATGGKKKHGVKQTDRLLSNNGIDVWSLFEKWVRFVVGERKEIVVALDWTDFDADGHSTLAAYLITNHGRATPLLWKSFEKATIKARRNEYEYSVIERLHECLAPDVRITLLADRGFGDKKLYDFLQMLGWDFVIRFRGIIQVEDANGVKKPASEWVPANGRALMIRGASVTKQNRVEVPAVVVVHAKNMKEPWCLATTLSERKAADIIKLYGKRFTIEETFRDQKNPRFGLGLSATHIGNTSRRDRLLLLSAIAQALLTLLGAAGEECGMDRMLKVNTVKRRTQSLFSQGLDWYDALPNMKQERLELLMTTFDAVVRRHAIFHEIFGVI
ncbi:MAG: IS4 family transposase [Aquincola sp.]|nr:IS4 family transposase [Aquincola sp.]